MRRTVLLLAVALTLIVVAPQTYSSDGDGGQCHLDITNNYYSDSNYDYAVGWDERDCYCGLTSGGSDSSWRYHEVHTCEGAEVWSGCQVYQSGTGWVTVECPDPGVTAQGRLHIPVG